MHRALVLALVLAGCSSKGDPAGAPATSASPAVSLAPSASAPAAVRALGLASAASEVNAASAASAASAAGAASAAAPPGKTVSWTGTFQAKPGAVVLNKEASEYIKVWAKDPGTEQVGEGKITLQIPEGGGPVKGEISGALGALRVSGELDKEVLHARVDPVDPNDLKAMTGVLQGSLKGSTLEVNLRVASRNANVVREAESKLARP
jgi:hypothetical protein